MAKLLTFATQTIAEFSASSEERGGKLGQGFPSLSLFFPNFFGKNPAQPPLRHVHRGVLPLHLSYAIYFYMLWGREEKLEELTPNRLGMHNPLCRFAVFYFDNCPDVSFCLAYHVSSMENPKTNVNET